jgi:hypothetical protein
MATPRAQALARHGSLYQRLLWLYPASFRREYGQAMLQVFSDRLRDEARHRPRAAPTRVWLHTLRDLALSVPNQRIEAFMSKQQTTPRQVAAVVIMVALSIAAMVAVGPLVFVPFLAVAGWLVYQERRGQYVRLPGQSRWHRWVLSGAALLAVGLLPAILPVGELSEVTWTLFALLMVTGLIALATGVAIGMRDRGPADPA